MEAVAGFSRSFRKSRGGMLGLVIILIFITLALLAPLLFSRSELDVTQATAAPYLPPLLAYPLGTDDSGLNVLALVVRGAWGTFVRPSACARRSCRCSSGHPSESCPGHFRGFTGGSLDPGDGMVPRHPLPAAGHRAGTRCSARACS